MSFDLTTFRNLVDEYVTNWTATGIPKPGAIVEGNNFGFETLCLVQNGLRLETCTHSEVLDIAVLLTRSLRGQRNEDHHWLWTWVAQVLTGLRNEAGAPDLIRDGDWTAAFFAVTNLLVARVIDPRASGLPHNWHADKAITERHQIAGPCLFALLEGLLRRKASSYIGIDGVVVVPFTVIDANSISKTKNVNSRLNRINIGLRLFEQVVVPSRGRPCPALTAFCAEVTPFFPPPLGNDVFDLIDSWRNQLLHGEKFWNSRNPYLMNLLCLLLIDEFDPAFYDAGLPNLRRKIAWQSEHKVTRLTGDAYPPDFTQ